MKKVDPDTRTGVAAALRQAFSIEALPPLLLDAAADAAFVSSIAALRGHRGGKK